jgi:hypothetical protein
MKMESSDKNLVDSSTDTSGESETKGTVAYDSYRKSVAAEKTARKRAQDLEAELESIRQKELEDKGNYQQLLEQYKNKNQELELSLKKERETYAWNTVTSAIRLEAQKAGCTSPDKLIKLLDKSDFEMLQSDNGTIKADSLGSLMDKARKENAFLFSQGSVKFNNVTPKSEIKNETRKSPSEMSREEIEKELLTRFRK